LQNENRGQKSEGGEGRMEDGKWRMEDGEWKMENGGWKMEDEGLIKCDNDDEKNHNFIRVI